MSKFRSLLLASSVIALARIGSAAPQINVGSDGTDGVLNPTTNLVIDLSLAPTVDSWTEESPGDSPDDADLFGNGVYDRNQWAVVFKFSSVSIPAGVTVTFLNHATRAPVVWLCSGAISIAGTVNVSGQNGGNASNPADVFFAEPGPGGFRGGLNRYQGPAGWTGSSGFGIGGSFQGGNYSSGASYKTNGVVSTTSPLGRLYNNDSVSQLIGGSGGTSQRRDGVGISTFGGGAGGGAILLASNATVTIQSPSGKLLANGGSAPYNGTYSAGSGSGGSIRIIADVFVAQAGSLIQAIGGTGYSGGDGRIRIESNSLDVSGVIAGYSHGAPGDVFLPSLPRVAIAQVDSIASGLVDPKGGLGVGGASSDVDLPTSGIKLVTIKTEHVPLDWQVVLRVTRAQGAAFELSSTTTPAIPALQLTGGPNGEASTSVNVDLSAGYTCLQAYAYDPTP